MECLLSQACKKNPHHSDNASYTSLSMERVIALLTKRINLERSVKRVKRKKKNLYYYSFSGMDPNDILRKYLSLGEGETVESWQSGEPMKAIKMMIRTKSGRLVEKTIFVSADDYDRMMREGGDPNSILRKYLDPNEGTIESWEKVPEPGMKVSVEEERINLQISSSVKCLIHRIVMSNRGGG